MTKLKAIFAAAIFALSAVVSAQQAAPTITPAQRAAAVELLKVMDFKKQMQQMSAMMAQSFPQAVGQLTSADSEKLSPEERERLKESLRASVGKAIAGMSAIYDDPEFLGQFEDLMAGAYARHFNVDELKSITAFYGSGAGKKFLERGPAIGAESMPQLMALMQPRMKALTEELAKEAIARAKKK